VNAQAVVDYLVEWTRDSVQKAGAKGVVFGLSGGVDSAVTALIAQKAFPDAHMALVLPCASELNDRIDAESMANRFGIMYRVVVLDNVYNMFITLAESYLKFEGHKGRVLRANIKSRLRMTTLYYSAQARDYLVLGTSNKSEINVGYATKYGDSGVDLQVIGDLLKCEVYELARFLKVPDVILNKPPSGGLWAGQTDEEELGFTYQELDSYLTGQTVDPAVASKIEYLIGRSEHKRQMPPVAFIPPDLRL